jgi:hypothetical protein
MVIKLQHPSSLLIILAFLFVHSILIDFKNIHIGFETLNEQFKANQLSLNIFFSCGTVTQRGGLLILEVF